MKNNKWTLLLAAWLIAMIATLGALFIGEIMGQAPCELCWYQRIAMFPLAWILGVAAFRNTDPPLWYALPLALAGMAIATFHVLLFYGIVSEAIHQCGAGPSCVETGMLLFGTVPIPVLSLVAFTAISILLFVSQKAKE